MEQTQIIDEYFTFLQNKTIKSVGVDDDSLVFILSDGSVAFIRSDNRLYISIEKHLIN